MAEDATKEKKSKARRVGGKKKLAPNKWLLRIFRGYDAEKKRIYHSEVFHGGSREVNDRLIELKNRQKAGLPLKFEPRKFSDFFEEWLEEMDDGERGECTIEQYRYTGNIYVLPAFGKFALTDVTDVAIQRLYKDLRKRKLSQSIVRQVHVLLGSMFKLAAKRELILQNPMTKFELAFFLGARPCEYLGLQWPDLNIKQAEIKIQRSLKRRRKGGGWYLTPPKSEKSTRTIPLTPGLVERLAEHRRHQLEMKLKAGSAWTDHGFIFSDEAGEPLHERNVRNAHAEICAAAGLLKKWQLKSSRHSMASAMLASGADLKMISTRLGHASIAITADIYTVVAEEKQREASERLAEAFGIGKK